LGKSASKNPLVEVLRAKSSNELMSAGSGTRLTAEGSATLNPILD
jgi:hypothetical protein